jgi:hypothetical protein
MSNGATSKALLASVKDAFFTIDRNFDTLFSAADSDGKKMLMASRDAARDAFFKAVSSTLSDNNVLVQSLKVDLDDAVAQVQKELKSLKNIAETIGTVAQVAKLAASITALAAAA